MQLEWTIWQCPRHHSCQQAGVPEPELRYESTGLWVVFRHRAPVKTSAVGLGEKLGETRAAIVKSMLDNPKVTVTGLAEFLGLSTTAVEKNIQYLKSQQQCPVRKLQLALDL